MPQERPLNWFEISTLSPSWPANRQRRLSLYNGNAIRHVAPAAITAGGWYRNFTACRNAICMEREIISEMSRLLEKTGIEYVIPPASAENKQSLEATLINLKSLNARYEKDEAISQVQWLMNTYNIQIDELMDRISS